MERFIKPNKELKSNNVSGFNKVNFLENLNNEQLKVINNLHGSMIVVAGAGSGKTRTITYCVAKLLDMGIKPSEIMLVTFTNKAANEMLTRIKDLLGSDIKGIWGGTFHSLANRFIRKYTHSAGLHARYRIIDQSDSYNLMNLSKESLDPNFKLMDLPSSRECFHILSYILNCNKNIKEVLDWKYKHYSSDEMVENLKKVFFLYSEIKKKRNLVDFNDLLIIWDRLIDEKEIAETIAREIKYVLVDEYQDTNFIQAKIIFKIASLNQNIMVVGDDAQSIYAFRGADFKNLLDFGKFFKNINKFQITFNYRSTPEILNLANDTLKKNEIQFKKEMNPIRENLNKPKVIYLDDDEEQAKYVIKEIKNYAKKKISLDNIAILYRSNFHSLKLQNELQSHNIPFEIRSGVPFFEQAHIKDVIAHLNIIFNPYDELSWNRIFNIIPNIGKKTRRYIFEKICEIKNPNSLSVMKKIEDLKSVYTKKNKKAFENLMEYLKNFINFSLESEPYLIINKVKTIIKNYIKEKYENYIDRINDIEALHESSRNFRCLREFIDNFNLNSRESISKNNKKNINDLFKNKLILSTIHKAKGLEWKIVFIISLVESYFPSIKYASTKMEIEEERRIFYVAITRAKDELYLIIPKLFINKRRPIKLKPSRFITELDKSLYELTDKTETLYEKYHENENQDFLKNLNIKTKNRNYPPPNFTTADKLIKNKDQNY